MDKNIISSKENETIKTIKKLKDKKYRDLSNKYVIEGIKLVEESIIENAKIKKVIICEELLNLNNISREITEYISKSEKEDKAIYVTTNVFKSISEVDSPQGIIMVMDKSNENIDIDYNEDIIVVLDDIQDPGNMGTILRTLDSIGLKQVIVSKNTVDMYNSKVIRSTMGAIFRINIFRENNIEDILNDLKSKEFKLMITSPNTKSTIYDVDYIKKVIVIGNEGNGVRQSIIDMADEKVKIPMLGNSESLNASVATGIVLYEYVRQKLK